MKEQNKTPKGWINIRVKPEEYSAIYALFESSTCRQLSEYVRKVLLRKPVIIKYRNQSADEILAAINQLRKELSAVGNNFNQTVHKLHTLDTIPEIKAWAAITESYRKGMLQKVEEIRITTAKIYEQWLHK